jgi:high affinity Mn2+ porin
MCMHRLGQCEDRGVVAVFSSRDGGAARGGLALRAAARMRAGVAVAALLVTGGAGAADLPVRAAAPATAYDWSGFYAGGHIGFAAAGSDFVATQPSGGPLFGTLDLFRPYDPFTGEGSDFGGFQAGYNTVLKSGLMIGVEADISFPANMSGSSTLATPVISTATYKDLVEMSGSVRARIGYAFDHWLYYGTAGYAWTADRLTRTQLSDNPAGASGGAVESKIPRRNGWTVGAGVEAPLVPHWTTRLEYLYSGFGTASVTFPLAGQRFDSNLSVQQVRVGLNYHFDGNVVDGNASSAGKGGLAPLEGDNWSVHGQTTFVSQYAPPFRAPYRGANSLDSNAGRETWDATLYAGRKLWQGAELWVNPEIDQGFGLSNTLGLAGFPSGEAYKIGADDPYLRVPRAFFRQTIELAGATEKVEPDINQFAGKQSADRLVFTLGKFSVSDVFDTVKYAHDPRADFMNWTLVDAGTFDYAADAWGYTYGATAEWYHGPWAVRGGLFDLSVVPNSIELDRFHQFQIVYEIEHRHEIAGQPGSIMFDGFVSRGRMGRFDDAIVLAQETGGTPDTALVRRYASRVGFNLNFEQQVVPNVGMFGRFGWADGNVEPYEFTDVDRTASLGTQLAGKLWGRPDDTFGLAGIVNGISGPHIAYLNAGGLGILVGDGQLPHPGTEQILETYYSFPLGALRATADYQFFVNPAYNRDRGPVSVLAMRLHAQF